MAHVKRFPLVSLLALGMALPAVGQVQPTQPAQPAPQAEPQAEPQDQDRDVVVVTAQKREESVQDIAVAVTAITDTMRDELGLTTVQDYTNFAPGLSYSTANDRIGMRGVTRNSNNFGIRSGISNYVDGVYLSSSVPGSREPIFVDRVEVVRGPQGTLYGRDAIGGALNVITKRPTDEFEGQFNIGVANYNTMKVEGTVSGPITDWLRYRVGGNRSSTDEGYFHNVAGGPTEGGRTDSYFVEGQLEGNIGETFDWWLRASTLSWDKLGQPGARTSAGSRQPEDTRLSPPGATLPNAAYGYVAPGSTQIGTFKGNPTVNDRWAFNADTIAEASLPQDQEFTLETIYHAPGFDVKYLGGYVYYKYNLTQENDGTPVTGIPIGAGGSLVNPKAESDYTENRGWYSNEINVLSTYDGPLQWIAGLYQYQENYTQPTYSFLVQRPALLSPLLSNRVTTAPAGIPGILPAHGVTGTVPVPIVGVPGHANSALRTYTNNQGLNSAYGAFLQGDYQLNDQFKFTAGVRYSLDNAKTKEYGRLICYFVCGGTALDITDTTWSGVYFPNGPGTAPNFNTPVAAPGVQNATAANGFTGAFTDANGNRVREMADEWSAVTGVLGVDWTPDDDTLIYAKYSRGYKSGGFGAATVGTNFTPLPRVDKELLDAYELGFKREWPSWNLTTNVAAFYYNYEGYQVPNTVVPDVGPAFSAFVNLPEVKTTGIEIETTWEPIDNLRLLANYAYLNPEIGDSQSLVDAIDPLALAPEANPQGPSSTSGQGQNLDGNILPFSPKNKASVNGTYTWDFEDGSSLTSSLSYYWQDISYTSIFNRFYSKTPAWDQIDGRLLWNDKDGHYTFILFAKNLLDELQYDASGSGLRRGNTTGAPIACGSNAATTVSHAVNPLGVLAQSCYATTDTYRPPRTYGVELQFHF